MKACLKIVLDNVINGTRKSFAVSSLSHALFLKTNLFKELSKYISLIKEMLAWWEDMPTILPGGKWNQENHKLRPVRLQSVRFSLCITKGKIIALISSVF